MHIWMLGLAAVALAAWPAAAEDKPAQDKAAVEVVKKAIEAHGGADTLNKYKASTMKMKGNVSIMGIDADFTGTVSYGLPDKFKMTMDADFMGMKLAIMQLANGKTVKITVNGMSAPISDAQKAELEESVVEQEVTQLTPLLDPEKYTLKAAGEEEVKGKKAAVVVVSGKRVREKEWKLFFDKDKGLLVKTQRKGLGGADGQTEVDEESFMEDYKKMDGVLTPGKIVVKHDGQKFMTMEITDAKYKEKVDEKEFATDD
jgi:hypothetical protein